MNLDELALAAQTDPVAMERLFAQLRRELSGFVSRRYRLDSFEVEDIVQNSLLVVHRKLGTFVSRGPGSLRSWARVIASYEAKHAIGKLSAKPRALGSGDNGSPKTGLSSQMYRAQLGTLLRAEARELPSKERRAIEVELDDGDLAEFAEREEVTRAAARGVRWRARKRLAVRVLERLGVMDWAGASSSTPAS